SRFHPHFLRDRWPLHPRGYCRRRRIHPHRQRRVQQPRHRQQHPPPGGAVDDPGGDHGRLPIHRPEVGRVRGALMEGLWTRLLLRIWVALILLFLFIPILLIFLYAFNTSNIQSWPIPGLTLKWFSSTFDDTDVRTSLGLSLQVGLIATALALVLGSFAAFAIHRMTWFGREVVSLMFILPLALPGIITGISLKAFFSFDGVPLS